MTVNPVAGLSGRLYFGTVGLIPIDSARNWFVSDRSSKKASFRECRRSNVRILG